MNDDLLEGKVNEGSGYMRPFAVSFIVWTGAET